MEPHGLGRGGGDTIQEKKWLPGKDSNPDSQDQNLLCYHYTTGQTQGPKSIRFYWKFKRIRLVLGNKFA